VLRCVLRFRALRVGARGRAPTPDGPAHGLLTSQGCTQLTTGGRCGFHRLP